MLQPHHACFMTTDKWLHETMKHLENLWREGNAEGAQQDVACLPLCAATSCLGRRLAACDEMVAHLQALNKQRRRHSQWQPGNHMCCSCDLQTLHGQGQWDCQSYHSNPSATHAMVMKHRPSCRH